MIEKYFINVLFFLVCTVFISCNDITQRKKVHFNNNISNEISKNQHVNIKFDSIIVNYWQSTEANEYYFFYSRGILRINDEYFGFTKKIEEDYIKDRCRGKLS